MEHLLENWPEVKGQLQRAKHILLLSDYDGTLTPIVEKPELANITEGTRQLLQTLAYQPHFTLGIISGRALADLKGKVNICGAVYAGNHGFEIEGPGLSFVNPLADEVRPFFHTLAQLLSMALEKTRGVLVEDKGLSLSVHYRQMASEKAGEMFRILKRIVQDAREVRDFRVTPGKKVYELRPTVDWDKGRAIRLLMKKYGKDGNGDILPIYLGDDLTDEDGFQAIGQFGRGITVFVGNQTRNTAADYFLKSPAEVTEFLNLLRESSPRGLNWPR